MKVKKRVNFRVEVYPDLFLIENDEEKIKQRTEVLLKDIKKHIDFDTVNLKWDTEVTCSFCGYDWEEDEEGCPVCCQKAQDEWKKLSLNKGQNGSKNSLNK